eukprot:GHRQ01035377.1.p1 GENE.GHRQ01035377.1~~GHRQ01035377.1.p1  ORF type:complete len:112 (+),score=28.07 GHRQ01035377.1:248-583(+)
MQLLLPCVHCAGRRASKITSTITSCFTGNYVRLWPEFLPGTPLRCTPVFDGRAVCYPSLRVLRDYLAWRQADTHINNQVGAGICEAGAWRHTPVNSTTSFNNMCNRTPAKA